MVFNPIKVPFRHRFHLDVDQLAVLLTFAAGLVLHLLMAKGFINLG